jgi:N-acetylglutamate synthase-like GNAT family acetyltransferase
MTASSFRVRRATLDDIGPLTALWGSMRLPVDELSKRITEFQVTESAEGTIIGTLGLQIVQKQGLLHSEAFHNFALADQLRPLLWERVKAIANNHGLLRFWTLETAPFWSHSGLSRPDAEALAKLPAVWQREKADWLTLKLREDLDTLLSADQQLAMFMDAEKRRTARTFQQAKMLKRVAMLIAVILLAIVFGGLFILIRRNPQLLHR